MDRKVKILMDLPDPIGAASTLDLKRLVACKLADQAAGRARTAWASAYPYQGEEYRLVADQAVAYQADPAGVYPALQADVDAGTVDPRTDLPVADLAQAADLVLFKRDLYEGALASIRQLRLSAKAAIKDTTQTADEAAIRAALAITWPKPS